MAVTVEEYIPGVGGKPRLTITSDKFNHVFKVEPSPGGFVFYEISVSKGKLPKELEGHFTKMKDALAAVKRYEALAPVSKTVKRDENTKAREAQKEEAEA